MLLDEGQEHGSNRGRPHQGSAHADRCGAAGLVEGVRLEGERHHRLGAAVLDGVFEQVRQDLAHAALVGLNHGGLGGQALVTVGGKGMLGVPGIAARTFGAVQAEGLSVSTIFQASSESSIGFTLPGSEAARAVHALKRAFKEELAAGLVDSVTSRDGLAVIAVVGEGMAGTLGIGSAVLDIAALSFLGLGADIRTPEWGAMIGYERSNVFSAPHLLFFPGLALTLTVLAYNLFGDGLRDALDPRLHR